MLFYTNYFLNIPSEWSKEQRLLHVSEHIIFKAKAHLTLRWIFCGPNHLVICLDCFGCPQIKWECKSTTNSPYQYLIEASRFLQCCIKSLFKARIFLLECLLRPNLFCFPTASFHLEVLQTSQQLPFLPQHCLVIRNLIENLKRHISYNKVKMEWSKMALVGPLF